MQPRNRNSKESDWLVNTSIVVIAAFVIAVALIYTQVVMIPFVFAVFLVSLVSPILDWQVLKLHIPRTLAVASTVLIVVFIAAIFFVLATQAIHTVVTTAGKYSKSFTNLVDRVVDAAYSDSVQDGDKRQSGEKQISNDNEQDAVNATGKVDDPNSTSKPSRRSWWVLVEKKQLLSEVQKLTTRIATGTVAPVLKFFSGLVLVTIITIFLLAGRNSHRIRTGVSAEIDQKIRRYIGTKMAVSTVTGVLVWAILTAFGLELASVFGILAFMLNFIPSVGSIVATLLPIPIAVAQFQNVWIVVPIILVPGLIQMTIGNVIEPKIMGQGLNLHPVTVLLALSFWGLIWGVPGMFLAAPMTAILRIVLIQFDTLRPVGNLMAGILHDEPEEKK